MPFLVDDVLLGLPFLVSALRVLQKSRGGARALSSHMSVEACRAAVPVCAGLKPTSSLMGGYMYSGNNHEHVQYLHDYLEWRAGEASGEDQRRIRAFLALQGREGSTSAVNTYDNQIVTLGTGWGGLGGLSGVMNRLAEDPVVAQSLAACGVQYLGGGTWSVVDEQGQVVTGQREALEVIRRIPALLDLFIQLAESPETRDAVTDAQLAQFMASSAQIPGSDTIATQALFNLAVHLKHWAPAYMRGVVEEAAQRVPGTPSADRDRLLAAEIARGFYSRVKGWTPDWKQFQKYVRDMRDDGLDVTADPVFAASEHPVKTAQGCGKNWASFKTVQGCSTVDHLSDETCGNWGPWGAQFRAIDPPEVVDVKVVGGPGTQPAGFAQAREVTAEPEFGWGETRTAQGPGSAPTQDELATIHRGVVEAVRSGDVDPIQWSQIGIDAVDPQSPGARVHYDLMVTNEPISSHGLRLPTTFTDAIAVANLLDAVLITPTISDARWAQAKRVHAQPLADATGALDYRTSGGADQVVRYNHRLGPNTGEFRDGFWKELVVHPQLHPSGRQSMAQYGFKDTDTHMFEHGGPSNHDRNYADYSDTPTYVGRQAYKNGQLIDLLDEYAAGSPLIGALPEELVAQFKQKAVA